MGRLTEWCALQRGEAKRSRAYIGPVSRRVGPLEKNYNPDGLPFRMRCGDRIAQLIVENNRLRAAGDYAGFVANLPEFRLIYDALHEPGDAIDCFDVLWPDWRYHAKNHHENCTDTSAPN